MNRKIFFLAVGQIGKAPDAVHDSLPAPPTKQKAKGAAAAAAESESDEEDVSKMQERLEALRS